MTFDEMCASLAPVMFEAWQQQYREFRAATATERKAWDAWASLAGDQMPDAEATVLGFHILRAATRIPDIERDLKPLDLDTLNELGRVEHERWGRQHRAFSLVHGSDSPSNEASIVVWARRLGDRFEDLDDQTRSVYVTQAVPFALLFLDAVPAEEPADEPVEAEGITLSRPASPLCSSLWSHPVGEGLHGGGRGRNGWFIRLHLTNGDTVDVDEFDSNNPFRTAHNRDGHHWVPADRIVWAEWIDEGADETET